MRGSSNPDSALNSAFPTTFVPLLLTLGRDYRRFNRYLESLVKFKIVAYFTRTRINTSKFGKYPCTNKEIMSNSAFHRLGLGI